MEKTIEELKAEQVALTETIKLKEEQEFAQQMYNMFVNLSTEEILAKLTEWMTKRPMIKGQIIGLLKEEALQDSQIVGE